MIGNGQCDWEIQNNEYGQCDYDRKDCKESQECLELPNLLNAKDAGEKCEKVNNSFLASQLSAQRRSMFHFFVAAHLVPLVPPFESIGDVLGTHWGRIGGVLGTY